MTVDEAASKPVAIVGGGPVGLITALGLARYGVPAVVFEADSTLSADTKAGTVLTRTLETLDRYDALAGVLEAAVRIDEVGELDLATGKSTGSVLTGNLVEDTRFPFVINIPQHELEPVLAARIEELAPGTIRMRHRLESFEQDADGVVLHLQGPDGPVDFAASRLLACDGGRSTVRSLLGVSMDGETIGQRMMLIDIKVDLDIANPRDYPYLAYFGDPREWMILVRQPHCWRFLFPLAEGATEPGPDELAAKARHFIGDVAELEVLNTNVYQVHQRVADSWRDGRVFLMGDAAHLITPMWALGLNTGALDASNLPWRLAWVERGWAAESLLDGYEREQAPVASLGSGRMAEAARAVMDRRAHSTAGMGVGGWGDAFTRTLLGVSLDVDGSGDWSMIRDGNVPLPVRPGDRAPDLPLVTPRGPEPLHRLAAQEFHALYFTDARRHPRLSGDAPAGLRHVVVSRWDAPHDSGLRGSAWFDPGDRVRRRFGIERDTVVLLRPDGHVAAMVPWRPDVAADIDQLYLNLVGLLPAGPRAQPNVREGV